MGIRINHTVDQDLQDGPRQHHDIEHQEEDEFRREHSRSIALSGDLARQRYLSILFLCFEAALSNCH